MSNIVSRMAVAIIASCCALCAQPSLKLLWETQPVFKSPESVVYDSSRGVLYVSNVNGDQGARDSNGFISKLGIDGAMSAPEWVKGLNAPKGLAVHGGKLYVADITELVEIDIAAGAVVAKHVSDGRFLNDVAVDRNGAVYVSDMDAVNSAIYRLNSGVFSVWLRHADIRQPNGVTWNDTRLVVGLMGSGAMYGVPPNRQAKKIGQVQTGIDGIVGDGAGGFFISDFDGRVSHLASGVGDMVILDTRDKGLNAADIEYVPSRRLLLVPTFAGNTVAAYEVTF
jgi:sugar lactone lactonase YvrE